MSERGRQGARSKEAVDRKQVAGWEGEDGETSGGSRREAEWRLPGDAFVANAHER